MPDFIDMTGQRFGRLLVLGVAGRREIRTKWNCRCDCGTEKAVAGIDMRQGRTKSCGCWREQEIAGRRRTHGMSHTRLFKVWQQMKRRCYGKNRKDYPHYGGRGIRVCDRWVNDFAAFYADMGEPEGERRELDRIDVDKDYCPDNCRWASRREQVCNTTRNIFVDHEGKRMVLMDFATLMGVPYGSIQARALAGQCPHQAVAEYKANRERRLRRQSTPAEAAA